MDTYFNMLINSDSPKISDTTAGSYGIGNLSSFFKPSKKSLKFKELAENRMSDALKGFQLISNLSNKNNYFYTAEQAEQIINAIEVEVENLKLKFASSNQKRSNEFTIK